MQKVELQRFYCFSITYAYTTGTLGAVQSTYTYTYGNAEWGDQLTAYRGTSIRSSATFTMRRASPLALSYVIKPQSKKTALSKNRLFYIQESFFSLV